MPRISSTKKAIHISKKGTKTPPKHIKGKKNKKKNDSKAKKPKTTRKNGKAANGCVADGLVEQVSKKKFFDDILCI